MKGTKRPYDLQNARVRHELPRPAERKAECKTLCHRTEPGLKLARDGYFVLRAWRSELYAPLCCND